ncbi:hypothetical protein Pla175_30780 [Pirellulimonas nuda]|uniref:Carboxypeptidase regulatory-like domain-containing protein n=1 Tax=Pirellulimonas nuda TaxID=2528009 RepID=A0A518DDY9_9BACT|nr:hypothetical protein [Pirellulimonas nuda]QDU89683.1 hypothetical protein Pla175_30780 [Pirellulimonas nuda]
MLRGILIALTAIALIGCGGPKDGRLKITGEVTFDGEPLKDGYLTLQPLGDGPSAGARIQDGRFTIDAERGPKPGEYRVSIEAMRETGKMISIDSAFPEEKQPQTVQYLPKRYNERSELTQELSPESKHFVWNLTSKDPGGK